MPRRRVRQHRPGQVAAALVHDEAPLPARGELPVEEQEVVELEVRPRRRLTSLQGVQRRALLTLKGHFQLDNLLLFNRKFASRWERRFVVYERRRDLPRVGVAALAAEAYLPFQTRR